MTQTNIQTRANLSIDYRLIRSKRKSVAIVINDGQVEVRAPLRSPKYWLEEFVLSKQSWIEKKLVEQSIQQQQVYKLEEGETLPFAGAALKIKLIPAKKNSISINEDLLVIASRANAQISKMMDQFLLAQAKEILPEVVKLFAKELGLVDKLKQLKFRKTKSKWGHCTLDGIIQLNYLILLAPESVQKYLIIHELCHLEHLNHSKAYWSLVEKHYPDYKKAQLWLKNNGHRLWYR